MTKYLIGDDVIEAVSSIHLVQQMADGSLSQAESTQAWMEDAAARYHEIGGIDVRTDTADNFVADLTAAGLVKEAPLP